jgi:hypothetical protein
MLFSYPLGGNVSEAQKPVDRVLAAPSRSSWRAPGFMSIVALLCLVIGVVVGASGNDPTRVDAEVTNELALGAGSGVGGADDGHDHTTSTADGHHDDVDGDHGDHAPGHGDDHPTADGHDAHGSGGHDAHGPGPDAHGPGSHDAHGPGPGGEGHGDHPQGEQPHGDQPHGDHPHQPAPHPICDLWYAYPQPVSFTPQHCADAQTLISLSRAVLEAKGFANYDTAIAAGYLSIRDNRFTQYEHLVNWDYMNDGILMDPNRVESLVYRVGFGGTKILESAMFILPLFTGNETIPAKYGSALTPWHVHTNLCWQNEEPSGNLVVGGMSPGGRNCPPDTFYFPTPPMLHVWIVQTPCGPFAEVEGAQGDCAHHSH